MTGYQYPNKANIPGLEYGAAVPIGWPNAERKACYDVDQLLRDARRRLAEREADAQAPSQPEPAEGDPPDAGASAPDDAPRQALLPGDYDGDPDATEWLALPASAASPAQLRAAQIALLVAEERLSGLPKGMALKFMVPHEDAMTKLWADVLGRRPEVFKNLKGTGGTYFPSRAGELWISLRQHPLDVARLTLHEAAHAWFRARGIGALEGADEEDACDEVAERLFPLVLGVAEPEGGLPG